MDQTADELFRAGCEALESDDPAVFMEWRRRVAVMLGPDHLYTELFQTPEKKEHYHPTCPSKVFSMTVGVK